MEAFSGVVLYILVIIIFYLAFIHVHVHTGTVKNLYIIGDEYDI